MEDLGCLTSVTKVVLLLLWTEHISVSHLSSIITTSITSSVTELRVTRVRKAFTAPVTAKQSTYSRFPRICVVFSKEKLVFLCLSTISVSACFGSTCSLNLMSYSFIRVSLPLARFFGEHSELLELTVRWREICRPFDGDGGLSGSVST